MIVTRKCILDQKEYSMDLDVTQQQLDEYNHGLKPVQHIFPTLSADEREFLISGITPTKWRETFGDNSDED